VDTRPNEVKQIDTSPNVIMIEPGEIDLILKESIFNKTPSKPIHINGPGSNIGVEGKKENKGQSNGPIQINGGTEGKKFVDNKGQSNGPSSNVGIEGKKIVENKTQSIGLSSNAGIEGKKTVENKGQSTGDINTIAPGQTSRLAGLFSNTSNNETDWLLKNGGGSGDKNIPPREVKVITNNNATKV